MSEYIKKINRIFEEIKQIKSAECIMDYDTKTEIIQAKKRVIEAMEDVDYMTKIKEQQEKEKNSS